MRSSMLPMRRHNPRRTSGIPGSSATPKTIPPLLRTISSHLGLGAVALGYVALDYWRERATWLPHSVSSSIQPVLWGCLAIMCLLRAPKYPYWHLEFKAAPLFVASLLVMILALFSEVVMVQFVTVVLGLDWHRQHSPLPDTGQWILLGLNDMVPPFIRTLLRMRLIELHHYIMLFIILAFSVLFQQIPPPGLGLASRYCLTMALSRTLRFLTFSSTILPAVRPWCAPHRFAATTPAYPHPWAQKYYTPYAHRPDLLAELLNADSCVVDPPKFPSEYIPEWGVFQFLVPFLRPMAPEDPSSSSQQNSFTIRPGGGCNDLAYSGHMVLAVISACVWQEAHPGWASATIWFLVLHSAQREIRERQHYSVDVIVALYMGVLLWHTTSFIWSRKENTTSGGAGTSRDERAAAALAPRMSELVKAAKDWDMEKVRSTVLAAEAEAAAGERKSLMTATGEREAYDGSLREGEKGWYMDKPKEEKVSQRAVVFGVCLIFFTVSLCLLAFYLTVGG